jgi:hypothetical protein
MASSMKLLRASGKARDELTRLDEEEPEAIERQRERAHTSDKA